MSLDRRSIALGLGLFLLGVVAFPGRARAGEIDPRQKGHENVAWDDLPPIVSSVPAGLENHSGTGGYDLCLARDYEWDGFSPLRYEFCRGTKPPWWQDPPPPPMPPSDLGAPPTGPAPDPLAPPLPDLGEAPTGALPDPLAGPDDGLPFGQ